MWPTCKTLYAMVNLRLSSYSLRITSWEISCVCFPYYCELSYGMKWAQGEGLHLQFVSTKNSGPLVLWWISKHVKVLWNWDLNLCYLTLNIELNQNTSELNWIIGCPRSSRWRNSWSMKMFLHTLRVHSGTYPRKKKSFSFYAVGKQKTTRERN